MAPATGYTWTGAGADSNWTTAANWSGGSGSNIYPGSVGTTDTATFSGTVVNNPVLNASQTIATLADNAGVQLTTSGANTLTLGSTPVTVSSGTVDFTDGSIGAGNVTSTGFSTTSSVLGTAAGVNVGFATAGGGRNWASVSGNTIAPLSSYTTLASGFTSTSSTANYDVAGAVTEGSAPNLSVNTLRFSSNQANSLTQVGFVQMAFEGGVLVSPTVGANTTTFIGGASKSYLGTQGNSSSVPLYFQQWNAAGNLVLDSNTIIAALNGAAGNFGVVKAGPGTMVVNSASAYTGPTTIEAGAFQMNGVSTSASNYTVNNGATLGGTGTITGTVTNSGAISPGAGTGSVGTLTISNTLALSSGATLNFDLGNASSDLIKPVGLTLGQNVTLNVTQSGLTASTFHLIQYSGTLTDNSSGFSGWKVTGLPTGYAGYFQVSGGFVNLVVPPIYTWTGANDATNHNWDNPLNWSNSGGSDPYPQAGDTAVFNSSDTVNVDGPQSVAALSFLNNAAITLTPTGSNPSLTIGNGGISAATGATANTIGANVVLGSSQIWTIAAGDTLTTSGVISGSSSLTKSGTGTLVFGSANTYTGATIVSSGTLRVGATNAVGSLSQVNVVSGATFNLNGFADTIGSLTGSGNVVLAVGSLTVGFDGTSTTFSGVISDSSGSTGAFIKAASGTLTLTGTNTYADPTIINAGTVILSGTAGSASSSAITVNAGATLTLDNSSANLNTRIGTGLTLAGANLNLIGNSSTNTSEVLPALTLNAGASTITVTPNSATNATLAGSSLTRTAGGTLLVRGTNLGVASAANAFANTSNITFSSPPTLTGAGQSGGFGTAGATNIGILPYAIGDTSATGLGAGFVTDDAANGIRLLNTSTEYSTTVTNGTNVRLTSSTGSSTTINSLFLAGGGTLAVAGTVNVTSGAVFETGASNSITANTLGAGSAEGIISTVANDLTISSAITGSGGLTKAGANTLVLTNASNSYSGGTNLNAGTISVAGDARLGNTSGALNFNGGALLVTASFNTGRTVNLAAGTSSTIMATGTPATGGAPGSDISNAQILGFTASNAITGSGNLIVGSSTNVGTVQFQNSENYTGTTTVAGGTLSLITANGTALNSSVWSVSAGANLNLGDASSAIASRISSNAPITLLGGVLNLTSNAAINTTLGSLILGSGASKINVNTAGDTLTFAGLSRVQGSTVLFTGTNLGSAPGAGNTNIYFTSRTGMLVGGGGTNGQSTISILPYALASTTAGAGPSNALVTYDNPPSGSSTGIRLLGAGETVAIGSSTSSFDNVSLPSGSTFTGKTVNAVTFSDFATTVNSGTLIVTSGAFIGGGSNNPNFGTSGTGAFGTGGAEWLVHDVVGSTPFTINSGITFSGTIGGLTVDDFAQSNVNLGATLPGTLGVVTVDQGTLAATASGVLNGLPVTVNRAPYINVGNNVGYAGGGLSLTGGGTNSIGSLTGSGGSVQANSSGATLSINVGSSSGTYFGVVANGNQVLSVIINSSGGGTETFAGANTYTGTTSLTAGTLKILADNGLGTGTVTFNGGTLEVSGTFTSSRAFAVTSTLAYNLNIEPGANLTLSAGLGTNGVSQANQTLNKSGAGTLTFTGASSNTKFGNFNISAGTWNIQATTSVWDINGSYSDQVGPNGTLAITGSNITQGANTGPSITVSGTIMNSGSNNTLLPIIKVGSSGALVINQTAGTTFTVNSGTTSNDLQSFNLIFDGAGNITSNRPFIGGGTLTTAGTFTGTLTVPSNSAAGNATLAVLNNGTISVSNSSSAESLGPNCAINFNGGTLAVTGTTTYTTSGAISLTSRGGTFNIGASETFTANGAIGVVGNGGTLVLPGSGTLTLASASNTIGSLSGSGPLNLGANSLTMGIDGSNQSYTGLISGSGGSLTKVGIGTQTLGGSSSNTYSGATTVNTGELDLNKSTNNTVSGSSLTINSGATVKELTANQIGDSAAVTINNGSLILNNVSDQIGSGSLNPIVMTGGNITTGTGTMTLGGTQSITYNTNGGQETAATISGNVNLLGSSTITVADGVAPVDLSISAIISGSGSITKAGAGVLRLSGISTYTGNTTILNGTVLLGANSGGAVAGALGNKTAAVVISGTGTNATDNIALLTDGPFTVDRAITVNNVNSSGTTTLGGNTADNSTFTGASAGTALTLNRNVIWTAVSGGNATVSGNMSGGNGITKTGNGTVTFTGTNSYAATTISAGTLQIGAAGASGTLGSGSVTDNAALVFNRTDNIAVANQISGNGTLTQAGSGTLTLTGGNSYGNTTISAGTLQIGAGSTAGSLGTGAVTDSAALIFNRSDPITVVNTLAGSGTLTQNGAGTVTLTATNNTYNGVATITNGTLNVGSGTTIGAVTVNSGTTLGGNGTVGAITDNGGTVSPGFSPGSLTAASGNFSSGGTLYIQVAGSAGAGVSGGWDQLTLGSGTLTVGGTSTLTVDLSGLNTPLTATGVVLYGSRAPTSGSTFTTLAVQNNPHQYRVTAVYGAGSLNLVIAIPIDVTVTSALNPSAFGQSVTFTAHVTNTNVDVTTGTVTFQDNGISIGTGSLGSGGLASYSTSVLSVATHTITATYFDSNSALTSTSAPLNQTVNKANTSTTVTSSANPSVFGQSVTFTAVVANTSSSATTSGTVTFEDNNTPLTNGTVTFSSGVATFTTNALILGTHPITAVYGDTANFVGSTSSVLTQTVIQDSTHTTVTSSSPVAVEAAPVTFTATVTADSPGSGTPTGTVAFFDNGTLLTGSTATLSNGAATFTTNSLSWAAIHPITAVYSGDTNFIGNTSSIFNQTVQQTTSTTITGSSPNSSVFNRNVSFTATVTGSIIAPHGAVTFFDNGSSLGTAALTAGGGTSSTVTFTTSAVAIGTRSITAIYGGEPVSAKITSASFTQTVVPNTLTWTGLATNPNTSPNPDWSAPDNWVAPDAEHVAPINGDDLVFPTDASVQQVNNVNDLAANTLFDSITFTGDGTQAYDITGSAIRLAAGLGNQAAAGIEIFEPNITMTAAQIFSSGPGVTLDGTISNGGFLLVVQADGTASESLNGAVSGSGGLTESGTGTLVLNAANLYGGTTTINGGTLQAAGGVAMATVLPVGTNMVLDSAGIFDVNFYGETIGSLKDGSHGGGLIMSGFASTLTLNTPSAVSASFTGVIAGSGGMGLVKSGAGTQILGGGASNTYSGPTTVKAGELDFNKAAGFNAIVGDVPANSFMSLTINGGAVKNLAADQIDNGQTASVTVMAGSYNLNGFNETVGSLTMGGGAAGTSSSVATGTGTLTLGGNVSYSGSVDNGASISGILNLNTSAGQQRTFTIADGSAAIDMSVGALLSGGGGLLKNGPGTLALSNAGDTFGGGSQTLTVSAGTLSVSADGDLGDPANTITLATGTLQSTATFTTSRPILLSPGGGIDVTGSNNLTLSGTISGGTTGTTALTKSGTGTAILTQNNPFEGDLLIGNGTVSFSDPAQLGDPANAHLIQLQNGSTLDYTGSSDWLVSPEFTLFVNGSDSGNLATDNANVIFNGSSGGLTGGGTLAKLGAGTLRILDATESTFTGTLSVNAGAFEAVNDTVATPGAPLGAFAVIALNGGSVNIRAETSAGGDFTAGGSSNIQLLQDASINVDHVSLGVNAVPTVGSIALGGHTLTLGGGNGYGLTAGAFTATGNATLTNNLPGTLTVASLTLNSAANHTVTLGGTGNTSITSGIQEAGAGSLAVTKTGAGSLVLAGGFSDNTGATTISAGVVQAGANAVLSPQSAVTVAGGATLDLNNFGNTVASLAGAGNVTLGTATLTAGGSNSSTSFSGVISGLVGGLIKTGNGTMTLSGANTYTGGTAVSGGTLLVNNPGSIVGNVTVSSSATLGGTGSVGAITADGTVSPGTSPGTLTGTSADLSNGGTLLTQVQGYATPGTDYDRLDLGSGTLVLGGTSALILDVNGLAQPGTAVGIALYGLGTGTFSTVTLVNNSLHGYAASLNYGSSSLDVHFAGPSTTTLTSAPNPSLFAGSTVFTATVHGLGTVIPTGVVTFSEGVTWLGTAVLDSSGTATLSTSSIFAVGNHTITVDYGGDGNYFGSTSNNLTQTVQEHTTTTVLPDNNPTVFGQNVTFTATVSSVDVGAGTPTGTVTFKDGSTSLGTGPLSGGTTTFTTSALSATTHTITALFSGTGGYLDSNGTLLQTVNRAGTTATLTASPNPSVFGQDVSFTATVNVTGPGAGTPTGTLTFKDSGTSIGTASLNSGTAVFTTGSLSVATHSVTATYGGDVNFTGSTSAVQNQTVIKDSSTTTVTSSANPSVFGQPVTITATVSAAGPGAGTPIGTVTFVDTTTATTLGSATVPGPTAWSSVLAMPTTRRGLAAATGPDGRIYAVGGATGFGGTRTNIAEAYDPVGNTWTTLAPMPTARGGLAAATGPDGRVYAIGGANLTVVEAYNPATGTWVTVANMPTPRGQLAAVTGADGRIYAIGGADGSSVVEAYDTTSNTWTTVAPMPTSRSLMAAAAGRDGRIYVIGGVAGNTVDTVEAYNPISNTWTTVAAMPTPRNTLAAATGPDGRIYAIGGANNNGFLNTVEAYDPVTNTWATVPSLPAVRDNLPAAAGPNGRIYVVGGFNGSNLVNTVQALNFADVATVTTSSLAVGTHSIVATYSGDTNFTGSSGSLLQTVNKDGTTTNVTFSPAGPVFGQLVAFTATVTAAAPGAGTPTATVTFMEGSNTLGVGTLSSGVATFPISSLTVGGHSITATYGGDGNFTGSSGLATPTISQANSATTVTSSTNPSVEGNPITFTAIVSAVGPGAGSPTGSVTFLDGGNSIGTASLTSGTATLTTSPIGGTHTIAAVYSGDTNFTISTSSNFFQFVKQASSTTITSSVNPSVIGQSVTFTATVNGTFTATGTVTFLDGSTSLGTMSLSGSPTATAKFTTVSALSGGTHTISAVYGGDTFSVGSSGSMLQTVNKADTTTFVSQSSVNSTFGDNVNFTASISISGSGSPTGTVTFFNFAAPMGTVTLSPTNDPQTFTAVLSFAGLSNTGSFFGHSISATYGGDSNFNGSSTTFNPTHFVTASANSTTTLAVSTNPSAVGQPISITATVTLNNNPSAPLATGIVTFSDGGASIGTATLNSSDKAILTTSTFSISGNPHILSAAYGGDSNVNASPTSNTVAQTVNQASTSTTVTLSGNPTVFGQAVTITATVSVVSPGNGTLSGTVTFLDGGASIGTGSISGGVATITLGAGLLTPPAVGTHSLAASFSGDSNFAGSNSATVNLTVNQSQTSTSLTSSVNPSTVGQSVTFTATVTAQAPGSGVPTGTVTFADNGSSIGTGVLDGTGVATLATNSLSQASHPITATYAGDTNYASSSSSTLSQVVNAASLQVSTFTSTPTGFIAVFNRLINVGTPASPILNLYDNSTGTMGPVDATLNGSIAGSIRGSLVVDQVVVGGNPASRITFIQTGETGIGPVGVKTGILGNDTYTVTLRSASNGFKDTNGNLLDGNGDGTGGDNFVTTFVINNSASSVTVTLPDFARGAAQTVNVPNNSSNGIPIRMLNNAGTSVTITSVTFNLSYDSTLLNVTGATLASGLPGDATFTINTSTAGLAVVTFTTPTGIVLGGGSSQSFIDLTASVPSTAGYAEKEILDLQNLQINSGAISAIDDAAIHVSAFLGDTTRDEIYTGLDAQRISRVAVGLDPGFRQWLLADPVIVGDVNGDHQLTGVDALDIARQAVGLTQPQVPSLPAVTPVIVGPDPVLSIPSDFSAQPQAEVQVPVNLDHPDGLASVDLAISYDTSRLVVSSGAAVQRGSLTQSFDNFTVNVDSASGLIRISGYSALSTQHSALGDGGSLAIITFQVRPNAPAGPAIINLMQNAGSTWSLPGGIDAQGNDFLFDLQPRLSNTAGDALDGRILVTPPTVANPEKFSLLPEQTTNEDQRTARNANISTPIPVPVVSSSAETDVSAEPPAVAKVEFNPWSAALTLPDRLSDPGAPARESSNSRDLTEPGGSAPCVSPLDEFFGRYPDNLERGTIGSANESRADDPTAVLDSTFDTFPFVS